MYLHRRLRLGLCVGPLMFAGIVTSADAQLDLQKKGPVVLHGGAGAVEIALTNKGASAISLDLKYGPFKDKTSQTTLAAPKVTFTMEAGGVEVPKNIDKGDTLQVEVNVSNLTGAGIGQVHLFNGKTPLGDLETVALDVPFNISIDGAGTSDKPLAFISGTAVEIALKNGDAETYPVEWTFQVAGTRYCGKTILAPNGATRIPITPLDGLFSWRDSVHPALKSGLLSVRLQDPDQVPKELLPARSLPVSLQMMRSDPGWTTIWSYWYAAILLLIGGILSLLGSSVLPNALRKISLLGQVAELADRTSSVSTRVDSYLRVLLRLERKNIDILLKATQLYWLTTSDRLDEASADIDKLTKRLEIAERLDQLRRDLEAASETAPPSVIDEVDTQLQLAASQLHSFALPDDSLAAAKVFLDKAEVSLAIADNHDALAKLIAESFKNLQTRVKEFPDDDYDDLKNALPGIFKILDKPFDDPKNITYEMAFAIDHSIAAIHTIFDYAMVIASTPVAGSDNCPDPGKGATQREHECELIALLGTMSWQALREARTLVREMRENIYEKDVLEEIGKEGQAEAVFDTQRARPYLPVYFSISFKDPRFNTAAAINRLACKWDFPTDLQEHGWKVCHFFSGNEPELAGGKKATIIVTIQSQRVAEDLGPLQDSTEANIEGAMTGLKTLRSVLEIQSGRRPVEHSRAVAEGLRFSIAFGVALAGLLAGALGQFQKLDFVPATLAIVALGFGADSIKNLLTQPAKKTAS